MVEMGTFVAILLGQSRAAAGSAAGSRPYDGGDCMRAAGSWAGVARRSACRLPISPDINWNPISETWRNLGLAHGNLVVFDRAGISWMWFFGAVFWPVPELAEVRGNEQVFSCSWSSRCYRHRLAAV
jgi:hypothetical protein